MSGSTANWWDTLPSAPPQTGALAQPSQPQQAPAAPQSYPVTAPHEAPDGSGMTNLSDADFAKFQTGQKPTAADTGKGSGAAGAWWAGLPDAPPSMMVPPESKQTGGGVAENLAAGLAEGGINMLAAPVNAANTVANLGIRGVNALTGASIPQFSTDVGGEASRSLAHATGGFSPTEVPTNGTLERMARASGNAVASLPGMALGGAALEAAAPAGSLAAGVGNSIAKMPIGSAMAPVMVGAAAGQGASEAVPEQYAPLANLAGNLAGGGLTALGQEGTLAAGRFAANQAGRFNLAPKEAVPIPGGGVIHATQAQQDAAAQSLYQAGGEPLRGALNTAPRELVPGDMPTTAQIAPTPGTIGLEKAMRQRPDENYGAPAFQERAQEQNAARLNAIQGAAPANANADSLGSHVAAQLGAIQDEGQRAIAGATGAVQGQTEALGGFGAPEQRGAALRGAVDQNSPLHAAMRQNESALWQAVDPNGTLGVSILPLKQARADLSNEMNPLAGDALHPAESLVFNGIPKMPDVVSYRTLSAVRKNIGAAERAINGSLNPSGVDPQALRRLAIMKQGVDASIADTINMVSDREANAVAAGQMSPADTILGRIQSAFEAANGTQGAAGGLGEAGAGAMAVPSRGAGPVSSAAAGTTGAPRGRSGNAAGGSGVSRPLPAGRKPNAQSLTAFLASRGGIQDQGGDLAAMDASKIRPGLVRKSGLTLDHAREIAEEEGYLRPGSDINELLDALDEEFRGNKVYAAGDDAAMRGAAQNAREGMLGSYQQERARDAVTLAEEEAGARLSQAEHDHATSLVLQGMHPEQAMRDAAMGGDQRVLDADVSRQAFGKPGVRPSAAQGEMGVGSREQPNEADANFDQAAADRYAAAREATRQRKQTYSQGVVGKILQPGKGGAEHAVADANVPRTLLNGGPDEATRVADFLAASGPAGHDAIKQALVGDLRDKGIVDADGLIGRGYDRWLAKHGNAIQQVPGLAEQFRDAGAAQHTLAQTVLEHAQRAKAFQDGIAGKLLGEDVGDAVRRAMSGQNSAQNLNKLVDLARGNADATDSLKLHVVNAILDRFAPVGRAGATMENALNPNLSEHSFLNANAYKAWVDANKAPLRRLFGGQGIQNFERVASSLRRAQYGPAALAGSQTAPNMLNAAKHEMGGHGHGGWNTAMALIGEHVGEHIGLGGLLGVLGGTIGRAFLMASRAAGVETVNDLKAAAMLHPDLAKILLERIPPDGKLNGLFGRRLVGAMRSLAVSNAGQQTKMQKEPETLH